MNSPDLTMTGKSYCNVLARQKGIDPAGHAGTFDDLVVLETPLPWKRSLYDVAGTLPQQMLDLYALWLDAYRAGLGYPHRALMVAPDAVYSREGFRRVMFYGRPHGPHPQPLSPEERGEKHDEDIADKANDELGKITPEETVDASFSGLFPPRPPGEGPGVRAFARYEKVEYLVPQEEVGPLLWAWYQQRDVLPRFDPWRDPAGDSTRDLLVCTHGTVDAACAKFGYPLYRLLRDVYATDALRVWRVSHFGGHLFAPTLMDLPTGHFWAYVEPPQAAHIARRDGDVGNLREHYRGWAGMKEGFLQAAERELWQHYGWAWLDFRRAGSIETQDAAHDEPQWAAVRIAFAAPDGGASGVYTARVEIREAIETIGTTGETATYPYEQYAVTGSTLIQRGSGARP